MQQEESKEEEEQPKLGESEQSDPSEEELQTTFGSGIVQKRDGKITMVALPFGTVFLPEVILKRIFFDVKVCNICFLRMQPS